MDRTGARWGLDGAETILLLRALITNGDFDGYWQFHLTQERHRNHDNQYAETAYHPDRLTQEDLHPSPFAVRLPASRTRLRTG